MAGEAAFKVESSGPAGAVGSSRIAFAGSDLSYSCSSGDTILSSALRAGLGLPHECLSGHCGKCYFDLVEGKVEDLWPEAPGLSPKAGERGRKLACQSRPLVDCRIKRRPDDDFVLPMRPSISRGRLVRRRTLAAGMAEFVVKTAGPAEFRPGQFCLLGLPGVEGKRAYSMSNLPNGEGLWEFIIRQVPGGSGTAWLFNKFSTPEDIVIDGPYGHAYLRTESNRDIVCIAGGSGLSPVLSIARAAVREKSLRERRISVFYGGRGPKDLCTAEFWAADPLLQSRASCHTAISDITSEGAEGWQGHRGYIHEIVAAVLEEDRSDNEYYLCGPGPMTDAVQNLLINERKIPRGQLHFDSFF